MSDLGTFELCGKPTHNRPYRTMVCLPCEITRLQARIAELEADNERLRSQFEKFDPLFTAAMDAFSDLTDALAATSDMGEEAVTE